MSGQGVENNTQERNQVDIREGSRSLRSPGMRDRDSVYMAHFREIERTFLEVSETAGFKEIRTPTLEPLHLYTTAETLTPKTLEEAYSFVDWDGWSGERVVQLLVGTLKMWRKMELSLRTVFPMCSQHIALPRLVIARYGSVVLNALVDLPR